MTPTILIAGIGNIFLGDDAFGVEVARSLARRTLPGEIQVKDFGDDLEGRMGLSPQVQAVVEQASNMIKELVERILAESEDQHPMQLKKSVLVADNREVAS